jgi:hypothetical protein
MRLRSSGIRPIAITERDTPGKVAGNAAQLQRGRDNGQHRRQLRILADPFDKLRVVRNAVGGGVVAAVEEVTPALDLQVAAVCCTKPVCVP